MNDYDTVIIGSGGFCIIIYQFESEMNNSCIFVRNNEWVGKSTDDSFINNRDQFLYSCSFMKSQSYQLYVHFLLN